MLAVAVLVATTAIAGCGVFDRAKDTVTSAVKPSPGRTPIRTVAEPNPHIIDIPAVAAAMSSAVKIRAIAPSCQKVLEGSGFVLSPDRVMTNAHVVAGASSVTVEANGNPYDATAVSYDPTVDVAILAVHSLPGNPLAFSDDPADSGADALVLGYPAGGNFVATPARIRETFNMSGPDIYRKTTVNREVYTIRATVDPGNTGGPLIDTGGRVLGMIFGAAVDDNDTEFALTAKEIAPELANIGNTEPVATGSCAS